jgi:hypothetical protein
MKEDRRHNGMYCFLLSDFIYDIALCESYAILRLQGFWLVSRRSHVQTRGTTHLILTEHENDLLTDLHDRLRTILKKRQLLQSAVLSKLLTLHSTQRPLCLYNLSVGTITMWLLDKDNISQCRLGSFLPGQRDSCCSKWPWEWSTSSGSNSLPARVTNLFLACCKCLLSALCILEVCGLCSSLGTHFLAGVWKRCIFAYLPCLWSPHLKAISHLRNLCTENRIHHGSCSQVDASSGKSSF